jgi:hypothetical protein
MLTSLYFHLARLIEIVEQGECRECYSPVPFAVMEFSHREVVRERHEADPRRPDTVLHGQCNGRDAPFFYGVADQSDGPVAQGSRGREQHDVYVVFHQKTGDLGCRVLYQLGRVVDGSHKGEVAPRELAYRTISDKSTEGLERKDGVKVAALVRPVVGMSPREVFGAGGDLTVGTVAGRVVDVEARMLRQVDAAGRDEREAGFFQRLLRPDERLHDLDVEADEHGVAVSYDVVAAFETDLRLLPGPCPGTGGD